MTTEELMSLRTTMGLKRYDLVHEARRIRAAGGPEDEAKRLMDEARACEVDFYARTGKHLVPVQHQLQAR